MASCSVGHRGVLGERVGVLEVADRRLAAGRPRVSMRRRRERAVGIGPELHRVTHRLGAVLAPGVLLGRVGAGTTAR